MGKSKDEVKPTAQEKALAEISKAQLARYEAVFAPLEDKWLKGSRITAGDKERLSGSISGNVEQAFAKQREKLVGANPAGGMFSAGMRDLAVGKGKTTARAQTEGNVAAENADVTALMSGVRLGRGQAIEAQAGMEQLAGNATARAIGDAFEERASRDATATLVGSGMGALAYGVNKFKSPGSGSGSGSGQAFNAQNVGKKYSLLD